VRYRNRVFYSNDVTFSYDGHRIAFSDQCPEACVLRAIPWIEDEPTLLGGSDKDVGRSVALGTDETTFVTGSTASSDFANQSGSGAPGDASDENAFVAKVTSRSELASLVVLGGSGDDVASDIAMDANGAVVLAGTTNSRDFLAKGAGKHRVVAGESDAFIAKLGSSGEVSWIRLLGGTLVDEGSGVAVDENQNVFVAGVTHSSDFPVSDDFEARWTGQSDLFVTKLSSLGEVLWARFLGGSKRDRATGVAVDTQGNALITGYSESNDFPMAGSHETRLTRLGGKRSAIVVKLSPAGELLWSRFLGGTGIDEGTDVTVDSACNAIICGLTHSADFPTQENLDARFRGSRDAFVAKVGSSGELIWSRCIGGTSPDAAHALVADQSGNVYVAGGTYSDFTGSNFGGEDAFVAKLTSSGELGEIHVFGGSKTDCALGIGVDRAGVPVVTGYTGSEDFQTNDVTASVYNGGANDAFVVKVRPQLVVFK